MVSEPRRAASPRSMECETSAISARTLLAVGVLALATVLVGGAALLAVVGHPSADASGLARAADWQAASAILLESRSGPSGSGGVAPSASTHSSPLAPLGVVNTVSVGSAPTSIAYDSGKRELFVVNSNSDNVSVIADGTGTVIATIAVGAFPYGAAYDSARNEVYVANTGSDNVSVISDATNRVVANVSLSAGDWPTGIVYDSGKGTLFVANIGSDSIAEISDTTNTVVNAISTGLGTSPLGLAYDSGLGQIFASLHGTAHVMVIDDTTLATATIPVGQTPTGMAYDSAKSEIFVANNGSNSVSVIADVNDTVVANVPVSTNPMGVAYGPGTGEVAVTYVQSFPPTTYATLGLIADANNTVVATVGLYGGGSASAVVYDSGNGGWYVADTAVDRVVVVAAGSHVYEITVTETGLPAGTAWQFWFNGTGPWGRSESLHSSSVPSARITAGNGSYTFTVVPVAGYGVSPASGPITVAGGPVSQAIIFSFLYSVTFTETGLPSGTTWSVTFAGATKSSNTATIAFSEGNGTYGFNAGAVTGYDASPSVGNVTVNGAAVSRTVTFTASASGAPPGVDLGLVLVGLVVVAVAVGAFAFLRMRRRRAPPNSGTPPAGPGAPPP